MQTGYCSKGLNCTFAHGYEDLRSPDTPLPPHVAQAMAARTGGHSGRSRSPAAQYQSAAGGSEGESAVSLADTVAVERARAMSAIAGVGAADQHTDPAAVASAVAAARSGAAFSESPYSDAVGDQLAAAQAAAVAAQAAPLAAEQQQQQQQ